ncbi:hypothetical protein C9383_15815 [Pseudomonas palleroniana]|uniref:Uncharacterized protein n=1 Tax=Pseudomonas palleroniana TaxID=191390 RepID=A0A1H5LSC4_9PSED|nr:hypothetical protein [Pseudomonas palleroniana]KAB0566580.1 hypothetical protein F7R03_13460 [Pseudomonas palleroniana]PTC25566.1 hypothetical protein C9383_15815 [Pseudomonas palleroniana]SEE79098.1 hypothetical protein SAMN04490198_2862 [Pseudomonas palleroniana]
MFIDGNYISITDIEIDEARRQLAITADFSLREATQQLYHDPGTGLIVIPMPADLFVMGFESKSGKRKFGVVRMNSIKNKIAQSKHHT